MYDGRGPSTSGITEIGNYGHTEKPEGRKFIASQWTYGKTECSYIAAEIRIYGKTEVCSIAADKRIH